MSTESNDPPDLAELDALPTDELRERAFARAERHHDVGDEQARTLRTGDLDRFLEGGARRGREIRGMQDPAYSFHLDSF